LIVMTAAKSNRRTGRNLERRRARMIEAARSPCRLGAVATQTLHGSHAAEAAAIDSLS
jgi:hypothetical protein